MSDETSGQRPSSGLRPPSISYAAFGLCVLCREWSLALFTELPRRCVLINPYPISLIGAHP